MSERREKTMSDFRICWLFPDTLFLHGERGNVLALAKYAEMAGFDNSVTKVDFDTEDFEPGDFDVIFAAAGEISVFPVVRDFLMPYRDKLEAYIEEGHPLVVTGTSCGLFGKTIKRIDGTEMEGLGIMHSVMTERDHVYGDDLLYRCSYNGCDMEITGSQISMAELDIGDEEPFGELEYGYGNTGKDRREGMTRGYSVFTNALGPVLVCNPWLTYEIIRQGAWANGKSAGELPYDMGLEKKSFELKKKFDLGKQTELTNCR